MKKVLFVDDDDLVLQGLKRTMRGMRDEWEMTFLDSGAKALTFMETAPVDIIVSDMRMPGMNGAQLLSEVMKRYPTTIRLILSGHADKELILKCVGATHQYLSKPCEPSALQATIAHTMNLEDSLRSKRLQQLINRMERLPSVPSLYSEIVEKMHDPEASLSEVGEIIARDIGMTAQILKLVNSAFFGLRREISSPADAVAHIGLETIKALVLSINVFAQYDESQPGGFSLNELWNHSLDTATTAKRIAELEAAERKTVDEAFVAGLLHDAGKAALACNFPTQYGDIVRAAGRAAPQLLTAEAAAFGANHAEVGGYLLGLWGLPFPIVEAIALHHEPGRSANTAFSPLTAVHVANLLVESPPALAAPPAVDLTYLQRLGLAERLTIWQQALVRSAVQDSEK